MHSDKPQKMTIPLFINVLKNYTDEDHTFTQEEIGKKLKTNYDVRINRKTLSRNLKNAMDCDENIRCSILKRNGEELLIDDTDENTIRTGFYYKHIFEKSELQALIYNVIFARHISSSHKKDLIQKLESLGSSTIRHNMKHYIKDEKDSAKEFGQLFWNLDQLDIAIETKKVVEFQYAAYKADLKLHVSERIWKVFPLGIAEKNNDYYLLGYVCGSKQSIPEDTIKDIQKLIDNVHQGSVFLDTFRIDKIRNLIVTENEELSDKEKDAVKRLSLNDYNKNWRSIQDYFRQNNSLSCGRAVRAKFKVINGSDGTISDAIDYFGKENIRIEEKKIDSYGQNKSIKGTEDNGDIGYFFTVKTNDRAMMEFAKLYAGEVEVLEPEYLREDMLRMFKAAYEKMSKHQISV